MEYPLLCHTLLSPILFVWKKSDLIHSIMRLSFIVEIFLDVILDNVGYWLEIQKVLQNVMSMIVAY